MSSDDSTVAVVIPTRNRRDALDRAIRSVLAQTLAPDELVVVDDGSSPPVTLPDDVRGDPRVRLVRTAGDGPGAARNRGVAETTASLVAFLDDDDAWRPEKLERQVALLRQSPDSVAAVECGFDLWENDRLVLRYVPTEHRDLYRTLLERPVLQPSTVLVRRSALAELDGFDPTLQRVEDWYLWLRLSERYDVVVIPEVLVDREHSEVDPAAMLAAYRLAVELFAAEIAVLPRRERRRIEATHAFMTGVLAMDAGDRRQARRELLAALRANPRWPRPAAHLVRATAGDRAWRAARRAALAGRATLLRAAGRDPSVRRW